MSIFRLIENSCTVHLWWLWQYGLWSFQAGGIKLERFAVLDKYRSNGIGAKITKFILNNLKETQPIYLFAQESAIKFYEKLGFKSIGNLFEEVGIKHQKMIYDLEGNKADLFPS